MSTRTIVEINHDNLRDLLDAELMRCIYMALKTSQASVGDGFGGYHNFRVLAQHHHSETLITKT